MLSRGFPGTVYMEPLMLLLLLVLVSGSDISHDSHYVCGLEYKDGVLNIPSNTSVEVSTMFGRRTFHYKEKITLFGPVLVRVKDCFRFVEGLHMCESLLDQTPFMTSCRTKIHIVTLTIVVLSLVGTILLLILLRVYWVFSYFRVGNYGLVKICKEPSSRVLVFDQLWDRDVKYTKLHSRAATSADHPPTHSVSVRITKAQFLLLFLFMFKPSVGSIMERIILNCGDRVTIENLTISTSGCKKHSMLEFLYVSYEYKMGSGHDYHCFESGCDSHGSCSRQGFSMLASGTFWKFNSSSELSHSYVRYCQWGTSWECPFTKGCVKGFVDIQVNRKEEYKIFKVFHESLKTTLVTSGASQCFINDFSDTSKLEGAILLSTFNREAYYCPQFSAFGNPLPNHLGDLQAIGNKWVMKSGSIRCERNDGIMCSVPGSFLSKKTNCLKFPFSDGKHNYSFNGTTNTVTATYKPISVLVTCPHKIEIDGAHVCKGFTYELLGNRNMQDGIIMKATPRLQSNRTFTSVMACGTELMTASCEEPVYYHVSDMSYCLSKLSHFKDHSIAMNADIMKEGYYTMFSQDSQLKDSSLWWESIKNYVNHPFTWVYHSSQFLIIGLALFVFFCKR